MRFWSLESRIGCAYCHGFCIWQYLWRGLHASAAEDIKLMAIVTCYPEYLHSVSKYYTQLRHLEKAIAIKLYLLPSLVTASPVALLQTHELDVHCWRNNWNKTMHSWKLCIVLAWITQLSTPHRFLSLLYFRVLILILWHSSRNPASKLCKTSRKYYT